jgi:hypothetical protein
MQMVQHHVIYTPERKENSGHNQNACDHTHINASTIKWLLILFSADPPPSHPHGLDFFFFLHVVPAFAGLQMLILLPLSWAGSSPTLSL